MDIKPEFRIRQQKGKYGIEYLSVKRRFIFFIKKEWKPFIHYSGMPDKLFWHTTIESLQHSITHEIIINSIYE
jgi:hypothetical protein